MNNLTYRVTLALLCAFFAFVAGLLVLSLHRML